MCSVVVGAVLRRLPRSFQWKTHLHLTKAHMLVLFERLGNGIHWYLFDVYISFSSRFVTTETLHGGCWSCPAMLKNWSVLSALITIGKTFPPRRRVKLTEKMFRRAPLPFTWIVLKYLWYAVLSHNHWNYCFAWWGIDQATLRGFLLRSWGFCAEVTVNISFLSNRWADVFSPRRIKLSSLSPLAGFCCDCIYN